MLNRAKARHPTAHQSEPTKRSKKQVEAKPTLIICKRNGEYIVEMKVDNGSKTTDCNPLIYKIAAADTQKIKAKARKTRHMIRKAIADVWSDPYHPEVCQTTCYKAYKQAVGLDPFDLNVSEAYPEEYVEDCDSCSCSDADSCSSLDVDWEIHFTPPRNSLR